MRKAPWPDYAGNDIHEGDTLRHPSGEAGKVVYLEGYEDPEDQWRVDYGDDRLRLCLQIWEKGQAVVVNQDGESIDGLIVRQEIGMTIDKRIDDYRAAKDGMQAIIDRHMSAAFEEIRAEYGATPTYVSLDVQPVQTLAQKYPDGVYAGCDLSLGRD